MNRRSFIKSIAILCGLPFVVPLVPKVSAAPLLGVSPVASALTKCRLLRRYVPGQGWYVEYAGVLQDGIEYVAADFTSVYDDDNVEEIAEFEKTLVEAMKRRILYIEDPLQHL